MWAAWLALGVGCGGWAERGFGSGVWSKCCKTIILGSTPTFTARGGERRCSPKPGNWENNQCGPQPLFELFLQREKNRWRHEPTMSQSARLFFQQVCLPL